MRRKNQDEIIAAVESFARFAEQVGAKTEAAKLDSLAARLQTEELDRKQLDNLTNGIWDACGLAFFKTTTLIARSSTDAAGKKQMDTEASQLKNALKEALVPPKVLKYPETRVPGLAGNQELTTVWGDPTLAPEIAKQSLEVVQQFSAAVFREDLETAYRLLANETRTWMSVKRLSTELTKANETYRGKAIDHDVERINFIYTPKAAELAPGDSSGFPKETPKSNRRATLVTFWFTNRAENLGRWAAFHVTEEPEGYRIAKFTQFLQ